MTTEQRAHHLAKASEPLADYLGNFSANDLIDWVAHELGHPEALDDFQQVGDILTKARPPQHLLHIISGNTPHAGLQSLFRGLLIGAKNTLKLPSTKLSEISTFLENLPHTLKETVTLTRSLSDEQLASADCVIAIGSDKAVSSIHQRLTPKQRFIPHGHKISFALIDRPSLKNAKLAAIDASLHDQQGCLSPHVIYVQSDAETFAPMLAKAMSSYAQHDPRSPLSISESGSIRNLRETVRYRAAQEPDNYQLYESEGNTHWTVIFENDSTLRPSPLNRTIYVRPWPSDLSQLGKETEYLSTIALSPLSALLKEVESLHAPRICQLGKAQQPNLFWHHDGFAPLASLVIWQDIHL